MSFMRIAMSVLSGGPLYLVWIGALVYAALKWKTNPRTAMFVGGAAAVELVASVLFMIINWVLPSLLERTGGGYEMMSMLFGFVGFAHSFISAAAFGLIVFAAFDGRSEYEAA